MPEELQEEKCEECGQSIIYSYLNAERKYNEASKKKKLCDGCQKKGC